MKKGKLKKKAIGVLFIIALLLTGGYFVLDHFDFFNEKIQIKNITKPKKEEKLKILNLESKTRPYAVMIDNISSARPQSNLDKAYLIYEIIVEGGLTRMMAVFKDVDAPEIGPVRSARHYFIDYALENDAIYVHHGRSPQALSAINRLKINDLEGLYNPSNIYWRDKTRYAPHNSYTSSEGILKASNAKKYRMKSDKWQLLNYSVKPIDNSKKEDIKKADIVRINFSNSVYSSFEYNNQTKRYTKYANGKVHGLRSNEPLNFKNIIITEGIKNYSIDGARQEIENIGHGTGWFISDNIARKITWEKSKEESKTIYKYMDGKILKVNDGNTYIGLQPIDKTIEIIDNTPQNQINE